MSQSLLDLIATQDDEEIVEEAPAPLEPVPEKQRPRAHQRALPRGTFHKRGSKSEACADQASGGVLWEASAPGKLAGPSRPARRASPARAAAAETVQAGPHERRAAVLRGVITSGAGPGAGRRRRSVSGGDRRCAATRDAAAVAVGRRAAFRKNALRGAAVRSVRTTGRRRARGGALS